MESLTETKVYLMLLNKCTGSTLAGYPHTHRLCGFIMNMHFDVIINEPACILTLSMHPQNVIQFGVCLHPSSCTN